jgi:flagellar biosynthesis protein FlhB
MAEDKKPADERTEEATPERREDFRERGQIAVSREFVSLASLAACAGFFVFGSAIVVDQCRNLFVTSFQSAAVMKMTPGGLLVVLEEQWLRMLFIILPVFFAAGIAATAATMVQTSANISWHRLIPQFSRLSLFPGLKRMVNSHAFLELAKGLIKMTLIGIVAYLLLKSSLANVPRLMFFEIGKTWDFWEDLTMSLIWATSGVLLVIAGFDYLYTYITHEREMKMTREEVKEEYRRREVDPHVKARMRRMQRDIVNRKMIEKTKTATVIITNPTHYAVALKYELGMAAPVVVAKGVDFLALRMREVAGELKIPIVENKPLARTLYKIVEVGQEIPDSLYKAVSEVIRYVFGLKGIKVNRTSKRKPEREAVR